MVETQYCIAVGSVPNAFYAEIAVNDAQREEWVKLFGIDEIKGDLTTPGYSKTLKPECNCLPLWVDQGDGGVVGSTKD